MIDELSQCVDMHVNAIESDNISDFKKHSDNFHDILYHYADNSRLYDSSLRIRSLFSILTNRYQNYTNAETVVLEEHKVIFDAIRTKDLEKAACLMENHFQHAKEYLLKNIRNKDETP